MISVPATACVAWAVGDAGHFVGYFVLSIAFRTATLGEPCHGAKIECCRIPAGYSTFLCFISCTIYQRFQFKSVRSIYTLGFNAVIGEFWAYENACNSFRSKEAKMRHNRTPSLELNAILTCFPNTSHPFLFVFWMS